MTQEHSPLPWKVVAWDDHFRINSTEGSFYPARTHGNSLGDADDAEFIVRAVNSHDDLVKALERYDQLMNRWNRTSIPPLQELKQTQNRVAHILKQHRISIAKAKAVSA